VGLAKRDTSPVEGPVEQPDEADEPRIPMRTRLAAYPRVLRASLGAGATRTDCASGRQAKHPRVANGNGLHGCSVVPGVTSLASGRPRAAPPCLAPG
jgi:hypothetical protein